jgi:hypothetical protein
MSSITILGSGRKHSVVKKKKTTNKKSRTQKGKGKETSQDFNYFQKKYTDEVRKNNDKIRKLEKHYKEPFSTNEHDSIRDYNTYNTYNQTRFGPKYDTPTKKEKKNPSAFDKATGWVKTLQTIKPASSAQLLLRKSGKDKTKIGAVADKVLSVGRWLGFGSQDPSSSITIYRTKK